MKRFLKFAATSFLLSSSAHGATIVSNTLFVTIADGGLRESRPVEDLAEPRVDWYNPHYPSFPNPLSPWHYGGYSGLGGGQFAIQTLPGETVLGVEIYLSVGPTGSAPWTFVFQSLDSDPSIQIWRSNNPPNGGGLGWINLPFQGDRRAPIYFEVQTSTGTTGSQHYVMSTVPEPSAAGLLALSCSICAFRRKRGSSSAATAP